MLNHCIILMNYMTLSGYSDVSNAIMVTYGDCCYVLLFLTAESDIYKYAFVRKPIKGYATM